MYCCVYVGVLSERMCTSVCSIFQRNISKSTQHVLPSLISAVGCLARDDVIRHSFACDPECWKAFLVAIVSIITDRSLYIEKYNSLVYLVKFCPGHYENV